MRDAILTFELEVETGEELTNHSLSILSKHKTRIATRIIKQYVAEEVVAFPPQLNDIVSKFVDYPLLLKFSLANASYVNAVAKRVGRDVSTSSVYRRLSTSGASGDQPSASMLNDSTFVRPPSTVTKAVGMKRMFWDDKEVDVLCRGWIQGIDNVTIATKLPLRSNSDVKDKKANLLFKYGNKSAVFVGSLGVRPHGRRRRGGERGGERGSSRRAEGEEREEEERPLVLQEASQGRGRRRRRGRFRYERRRRYE